MYFASRSISRAKSVDRLESTQSVAMESIRYEFQQINLDCFGLGANAIKLTRAVATRRN